MDTAHKCKIMQVGRWCPIIFRILSSHVQQADVAFQTDLEVFPKQEVDTGLKSYVEIFEFLFTIYRKVGVAVVKISVGRTHIRKSGAQSQDKTIRIRSQMIPADN